jgi:ATP-binding cassette subfamily B protein
MRNLAKLLHQVVASDKLTSISYVGCALVASFLGLASLWVTAGFGDSIAKFIAAENFMLTFEGIVFFVLVQIVIEIVQFILNRASSSILSARLGLQMTTSMMRSLFNSLWRTDPCQFDSSEKMMEITSLYSGVQRYGAETVPFLYSGLKSLFCIGIYFVVLSHVSLWASLISLVLTLPTVYVNVRFVEQDLKLLQDTAPEHRLTSRLLYQMTSPSSLREAWVFGCGPILLRKWETAFNLIIRKQLRLARRQTKYSTYALLISQVLGAITLVFILLQARTHNMSIGGNLALIQAMGSLEVELTTLLSSCAKLYEGGRYLDKLEQLGSLVPSLGGYVHVNDTTSFQEIRINNLYYLYPSRTVPALSNISLTIANGEKIVIVGRNGSGKSTLAKCIIGMYKPTSGEVSYVGRSRQGLSPKVSCVFQDYEIYPLSLIDNIAIGNPHHSVDMNRIWRLISGMGLTALVERLPCGLHTVLDSSIEGGTILSQGELQKIAICRALYSNPSILLLDEPTASLDPISEWDIYKRVLELMRDQTLILISHRLMVCPLVDRVVVLDDGNLVDTGSHVELLQRCKVYQQLYSRSILQDDIFTSETTFEQTV